MVVSLKLFRKTIDSIRNLHIIMLIVTDRCGSVFYSITGRKSDVRIFLYRLCKK